MLHWGAINLTIDRGVSDSHCRSCITSVRLGLDHEAFNNSMVSFVMLERISELWYLCALLYACFSWESRSVTLFSEMPNHKEYFSRGVIHHSESLQRLEGTHSLSKKSFDILQKKQVESPTPFFKWLQKKEPDDRMDHQILASLLPFILFFTECLCAQRIQGSERINAARRSPCSWRLMVSSCSLWSWEASQMKSQVWKEAGPGLSPSPGFLWTNTYC